MPPSGGDEARCCDVCWSSFHDGQLAAAAFRNAANLERRLRRSLERESSFVEGDEESLVRVFALDGAAITLPVDETTTAAALGQAASERIVAGADCGLWTASGGLDTLERLDGKERVSDVLARWRLAARGAHASAKFVVPIRALLPKKKGHSLVVNKTNDSDRVRSPEMAPDRYNDKRIVRIKPEARESHVLACDVVVVHVACEDKSPAN